MESGDCQTCHNPHASTNKFLLTRSGKNLCGECHDDIPAPAKVRHSPVESGDCAACHTPHASTNRFLVTKTGPALCFDCHDDFLAKAKVKHAPVEQCSDCHQAHQANEKGLLPKPAGQLCLDCHEQKDLESIKGHERLATVACVTCHDPHAGAARYLLTAEGAKARPAQSPAPAQ